MKIPLNLMQEDGSFPQAEHERALESDVFACRQGDWEAKARLMQEFMPLMTSLAKRRAKETVLINQYIDAGKSGLTQATHRYRPSSRMKFQIFALGYIEKTMNQVGQPTFFNKLFGGGA